MKILGIKNITYVLFFTLSQHVYAEVDYQDNKIAKTYAPTVNLCNMKTVAAKYKINTTDTMPMSVDQYLSISNLYDNKGTLVKEGLSTKDIAIVNSNYFIQPKLDASLSGSSDPQNTPMYYHIKKYGDNLGFIDVQYHMFYALNNSQYFRSGKGAPGSYTRNWQMDYMARHWGDWEHVTVRVNTQSLKVEKVFFSAHGKGYWTKPKFEEGTHPVVYSACNSHANYDAPKIVTLEDNFYGVPEMKCSIWMKVTDNAEFSNIPWRPWKASDDKLLISFDEIQKSETKWLNFEGAWGSPKRPLNFAGPNGDAKGKAACIKGGTEWAMPFIPQYRTEPGGPTGPWTKPPVWDDLQ
jgi:hypothetical protein